MSFAHPSALWLLALLPILWLVHRRRPRQRVMIANLFLWRSEGRPEPALLSRWRRRNPLLWVQMAVLAALALVLAGPSWTARRNTIAVVIDVSLSMGARDGTATRLDLARTRVRALLGAEARGATLHLWTAGGTAAEVGSFSATDRALQQALDDLEPTDGRADIAGAVRRARQSDAAPRRIYVVSDSVVSDSVVSGSVASDSPTPLGAPDVEWLPVGRPAENLAITSMAVTRVPGQLDETRVFVDVRNFGTASRGVRVAISRDGRVLSRQAVEVPALRTVGLVATTARPDGAGAPTRGDRTGTREGPGASPSEPSEGTLTATLETDDALTADNVRYAIVPPSAPTRVAVFGSSRFLDAALRANTGVVRVSTPDEAHDVVVCLGCAEPPSGDVGVLLVPSSSDSRTVPPPPGGTRPSPVPLAVGALDHPITRGVSLDGVAVVPLDGPPSAIGLAGSAAGAALGEVSAGRDARGAGADAAVSATVIARAGTRPVIVATEIGRRRIVEMRVDLLDPGLALNPAYPLLVANTLEWLGGRDRMPTSVRAGDPLQWVLPRLPRGPVAVTGPDGRAWPVAIVDGRVTVADTSKAGIYRVTVDGEALAFASNPAHEDSDLSAGPSRAADGQPPESSGPALPASIGASLAVPLILLALLGVIWETRLRHTMARGSAMPFSRARVAVRIGIAALLLAALGGLRFWTGAAPRAAVFLLDQSASVSRTRDAALAQARALARTLEPRDQAGLAVFGAGAAIERRLQAGAWPDAPVQSRVDESGTNLEAGLQAARAALPAAGDRRIVLFTDGHQTTGDARREAVRAAAARVRIDVVPTSASTRRDTAIARVSAPPVVRAGEPFDVGVVVEGPPGASGEVVLLGAASGPQRQRVLIPGAGVVAPTFRERDDTAGVHVYRAAFVRDADDFGDSPDPVDAAQMGVAVAVVGAPRVLYVGAHAATIAPLLTSSGMRADRLARLPRDLGSLAGYDAVILDDTALGDSVLNDTALDSAALGGAALRNAVPDDSAQRRALVQYVDHGGGLLVLGSERSLTPGFSAPSDSSSETTYEGLLPVDLRPRRGERTSNLALVIAFDKSGSMEERVDGAPKIEYARQAIRSVAAALPPGDAIGVIAFDAQPATVVPLGVEHDAARLDETLRAVQPEGATAIAPALERAAEWLAAPRAGAFTKKHVLLLTDGQTSADDMARVRRIVERAAAGAVGGGAVEGGAAARTDFVLSVVALGAGGDRATLSALAERSGGRAYFPGDVRELPRTVAREATRVAGGRTVETSFVARASGHAILSGLATDRMPRLGGYVVTAARTGAEVVLRSHLDDPVLAVWRRGVGRVGVYTADLHSDWSSELARWDGFGPWFRQTVRWVSRRVDHPLLHASLRHTVDGLSVEVETGSDDGVLAVPLDVQGTMTRPRGDTVDLAFEATGLGRYQAVAPLGAPGTYLVAVSAKSPDGVVDGTLLRGFYWSASQERERGTADLATLAALAATTGGRVLSADATALPDREPGYQDGRPWLTAAAFGIFFVDAVLVGLSGLAAAALKRRTSARPVEQLV